MLLNSFQHTELLSVPQQVHLPKPSPKPVQEKQNKVREEDCNCLGRPPARVMRRHLQAEERPINFYAMIQEPDHPQKVSVLVLP